MYYIYKFSKYKYIPIYTYFNIFRISTQNIQNKLVLVQSNCIHFPQGIHIYFSAHCIGFFFQPTLLLEMFQGSYIFNYIVPGRLWVFDTEAQACTLYRSHSLGQEYMRLPSKSWCPVCPGISHLKSREQGEPKRMRLTNHFIRLWQGLIIVKLLTM